MAASCVLKKCMFQCTNRSVTHKIKIIHILRFCSSHVPEGHVPPPSLFSRYLLDRVTKFVDGRTLVLEKNYPKVFQIYQTFRTGFTSFKTDAKDYYQITSALWAGRAFSSFSRSELEIYRQFPKDIRHFLPILLITLIPGGSFIFPLAYYFPRYLLSQHFWTAKQKAEFCQENLKSRLRHYPYILHALLSQTKYIGDLVLKEKIVRLLRKLEHGVQLSVKEILEVKPLFCLFPYRIERMPITYVRHLGKAHDMSQRRTRLMLDGILLLNTDQAMVKEGLDNLDDDALEKVCFWRGLNPVGLRREERIEFLQHWTQISQEIDDESISFLLHCGMFLTYTRPTNRDLMGHNATLRNAPDS